MHLPFTDTQFLEVFFAYNAMFWWVAILLWLATSFLLIQLIRQQGNSLALTVLAAVHWLWSGLVYHAVFFTPINSAAWVFALLFISEGLAFIWFGAVQRRLTFRFETSPRAIVGLIFVIYSLSYPVFVLWAGFRFPFAPGFAVPCPTTIFTVGLLLTAVRPVPGWLIVVPVVWSVIGGSAALVLGMTPDLALFVGGVSLLVDWTVPHASRLATALR